MYGTPHSGITMISDVARMDYLLRNRKAGKSRHFCSVKAILSLQARDRKERSCYAFTFSFQESDPLIHCIGYFVGGSSIIFLSFECSATLILS